MAHILHIHYLFDIAFWIRDGTPNYNVVPEGKDNLLYDNYFTTTISRNELWSTYNL